ncbi:MAG: hypothetical protein AAF367_01765 [Pseudomonadota bacterium]
MAGWQPITGLIRQLVITVFWSAVTSAVITTVALNAWLSLRQVEFEFDSGLVEGAEPETGRMERFFDFLSSGISFTLPYTLVAAVVSFLVVIYPATRFFVLIGRGAESFGFSGLGPRPLNAALSILGANLTISLIGLAGTALVTTTVSIFHILFLSILVGTPVAVLVAPLFARKQFARAVDNRGSDDA